MKRTELVGVGLFGRLSLEKPSSPAVIGAGLGKDWGDAVALYLSCLVLSRLVSAFVFYFHRAAVFAGLAGLGCVALCCAAYKVNCDMTIPSGHGNILVASSHRPAFPLLTHR